MSKFLGTYADLTGKRVGKFTVEQLAGRDKSSAPRWRILCSECSYPTTMPHAKLAPLIQGKHSQTSLLCQNPACPLSRHEREIETINDLRRKERQETIRVAEAQKETAVMIEKDRQKAARAERIRRDFASYLNHQWRVGAPDEEICTSRRWALLSDSSRKAVLDAMKQHPNARLTF